jgi:hypothetical protein
MADPINTPIHDKIHVEPIVRISDGEPSVELRWGDLSCQLSPEDARQHALDIIVAAKAAEQDAAVVKWSIKKREQSPEDVREWARLMGKFKAEL